MKYTVAELILRLAALPPETRVGFMSWDPGDDNELFIDDFDVDEGSYNGIPTIVLEEA